MCVCLDPDLDLAALLIDRVQIPRDSRDGNPLVDVPDVVGLIEASRRRSDVSRARNLATFMRLARAFCR